MTKIVAIMGRKGGITKSTIAKTLAAGAARQGLRTVLVDADGQGNASSGVQVQPHDGFYDLILKDAEFADVLQRVPVSFTGDEKSELYLLSSFNAQRLVEKDDSTSARIYQRFQELRGWADVVIVDTSPGITEVHTGFYYTADYILLPTLCEMDSILSLSSTIAYLQEAEAAGEKGGYMVAEVLGIIPNRFDSKENVQTANVGYVRGRYDRDYPIFDPISDLTVWNQASQLRTSIYAFAGMGSWNEKRSANRAIREFKPILKAITDRLEVADVQK